MRPVPQQLLSTPFPGFAAPAREARASLIIVHGLAEYAGRYLDIAQTLSTQGVSCFAYDQIGHGDRPGVCTHVSRFDEYVDELLRVIEAVRSHSPAPLFVWGHSMGSVVATLAAARAPERLAGVITSSSSLEIFRRGVTPLNPFFRAASVLVPRVRIPLGLDARKISSDESVQRAYASDPKIPPTASLRLIVEFARACERCREIAPTLRAPWLVIHGEEDRIAPAPGSQALFDALGSTDKQLRSYAGLRHEVHNELPDGRKQMLALMTDWIAQRSYA